MVWDLLRLVLILVLPQDLLWLLFWWFLLL
jgi:hypothetical protein